MNLRSLTVGLAIYLFAHGVCLSQQTAAQPSSPWMDASLPPDQRADLVMKQLTLDEKIQLAHGIGWGPLVPGSPVPPDNNGGAGQINGTSRVALPSWRQAASALRV